MFSAPTDVRLPRERSLDLSQVPDESLRHENVFSVVQPDILVVCDPRKIDRQGVVGAPDWVIEIISESTSGRDQFQKYDLYERSGVREYWIVNPKQFEVAIDTAVENQFTLHSVQLKGTIHPVLFPQITIDLDLIRESLAELFAE